MRGKRELVYLGLVLVLALFGFVLLTQDFNINPGVTGYAVLEISGEFKTSSAGDFESGAYWERDDKGTGRYNTRIYNSQINYYNGTAYERFQYGPCGSGCFRDHTGLIYRVGGANNTYINLYDIDDNLITSFGFGIRGDVGGNTYIYTTLNYSWIWSGTYNSTTKEYVFYGWNNKTNFNWTQEYHFYPDKPMKITNHLVNNIANIYNTTFFYIHTVDSGDGVWYNGTHYTSDDYITGNLTAIAQKVTFDKGYAFNFSDVISNGFDINEFYLGDGSVIGVSGVRIMALGMTKNAGTFPNGASVAIDPSVTISGSNGEDAYVSTGNQNRNYGDNTVLRVQRTAWQRSYIKFNLSTIPVNQVIDDATACFYLGNDQGDQNITINHVYDDSWCEGDGGTDGSPACEITWNNQPCGDVYTSLNDTTCNNVSEDFMNTAGGEDDTWQCLDVTNMTANDYSNSSDSFLSVVLWTTDSGAGDIYQSKENGNSSQIPYLNITHHDANRAPDLRIFDPTGLYTNNNTIPLTFFVNDTDDNLDSCWYSVDGGVTNTSILGCSNTTFGISEGSHTLAIYANDTDGFLSKNSSSFNADPTGVQAIILTPTGTINNRSGIALTYTAIGINKSCWYNVKTSIGGSVISDTGLSGCSSSSFDVSVDGDYILNLFVNNSLGSLDNDSSSFTVDTSPVAVCGNDICEFGESCSSCSKDCGSCSSGGSGGGSGGGSIQAQLAIENISAIMSYGEEKTLKATVKNNGLKAANKCKLVARPGFEKYFESSDLKNIGAGELIEFNFLVKATGEDFENIDFNISCLEGLEAKLPLKIIMIRPSLDLSITKINFLKGPALEIKYLVDSTTKSTENLKFRVRDSSKEIIGEVSDKINLKRGENEGKIEIALKDPKAGMLKISVSESNKDSVLIEETVVYDGSIPLTGKAVIGIGTISYLGIMIFFFVILAIAVLWRIVILHRGGPHGVRKKSGPVRGVPRVYKARMGSEDLSDLNINEIGG